MAANPVSKMYDDQIGLVENEVLSLAKAMPAAIVLQEESPFGPGKNDNGPDSVQSKDEIVRYLEDAIAYARKAAASLDEKNQLNPIQTYFGPMPRSAVAAGIAYHSFNHYGQMVVYARMNGIVPPASSR